MGLKVLKTVSFSTSVKLDLESCSQYVHLTPVIPLSSLSKPFESLETNRALFFPSHAFGKEQHVYAALRLILFTVEIKNIPGCTSIDKSPPLLMTQKTFIETSLL